MTTDHQIYLRCPKCERGESPGISYFDVSIEDCFLKVRCVQHEGLLVFGVRLNESAAWESIKEATP